MYYTFMYAGFTSYVCIFRSNEMLVYRIYMLTALYSCSLPFSISVHHTLSPSIPLAHSCTLSIRLRVHISLCTPAMSSFTVFDWWAPELSDDDNRRRRRPGPLLCSSPREWLIAKIYKNTLYYTRTVRIILLYMNPVCTWLWPFRRKWLPPGWRRARGALFFK